MSEQQTQLDTKSALNYTVLVTFRWGSGVRIARGYTRFSRDIVIGDARWVAEPAMEIEMPKMDGGAQHSQCRITMPMLRPAKELGEVYPWPLTLVEIEEVDLSNPTDTRNTVFFGEVRDAVRNPDGQPGLVRITIDDIKKYLDRSLGIVCGTTCSHSFGDKNCCVELDTIREQGTIQSIDGNNLVISGVNTTTRYWHRGEVVVGGLRIMVRDQDSSSFTLVKPAPPWWLGQTATLTPGCDKTIETCRTKWDNEEHFGGFGHAIPAYHPIFETS
jgi:hypothetical protein